MKTFKAIALSFFLLCSSAFADVRDFSTDRPSRSDSAFTVPNGYFQVETDLLNYTNTSHILESVDPVLKYGVSNSADIEAEFGGLLTNTKTDQSSFGDITVRLKYNVVGNDGGNWVVAIIPYVKIPASRKPFGNGTFEGGVLVPVQYSLPFDPDTSITFEEGVADLRDANRNSRQGSFIEVINATRKIYGDLSGEIEVYNQYYGTDKPTTTFDLALLYSIDKNKLQLDIGTSTGLNRASTGTNFYAGISFRFQ